MTDATLRTLELATATELAAFAFCREHDWAIEIGHDDAWTPATKWPEVTHIWDDLERRGHQLHLQSSHTSTSSERASEVMRVHPRLLEAIEQDRFRETPEPIFLDDVANEAFRAATTTARSLSTHTLAVSVAYSAKTNPDPRLLRIARHHGAKLEAISQHEVAAAIDTGYRAGEIVLNGPAKWWPRRVTADPLHAIFCDSLEELSQLQAETESPPASIVGVRLRPPASTSRFGINAEQSEVRARLVQLLRDTPVSWGLGYHFHIQSSVIGTQQWWRSFESMLALISQLQDESGRTVHCLDIGGGWDPGDWDVQLLERLPHALEAIRTALPSVRELIVEPGKALTQASGATLMTILEVRRDADNTVCEVVVDGSVAEVPQFYNYPHPIAMHAPSGSAPDWLVLGRGGARILGRLCMEKDIIATRVAIPPTVARGDHVLVLETGAYDQSTAYAFGLGTRGHARELREATHAH